MKMKSLFTEAKMSQWLIVTVAVITILITTSSSSTNYASSVPKKILIATYNVEGNPASKIDLKSLLNLGHDANDLPDIIAVG